MTLRYEEFRDLHRRPGAPLVLPNAWDHASAAALVAAGFRAIGTTSLGVAAAAGLPDGTGAARAQTVRLARGLARTDALVTVDIEGGFSDRPEEVAALVGELADAGIVGVNIEDGRPDGTLRDAGHQSEILHAVRETASGRLFVNARTDTYWLPGAGAAAETADRLRAYQRAGADGVFVPGLRDVRAITELAAATLDTPLNILHAPDGPSLAELAEAGVRRISTGSLLFRAALGAAVAAAASVARGVPVPARVPSYAETQALSDAAAVARSAPGQ
ncbi:isocitrate lyase/PEP mutase family protein [Streptomyces kanamyceticus]|uniref:Isocitrate lyase/phosphoenolpyruvate mutase family protein n=1 Tax=Streptomyces kanamyceticus TaxID=1967 RepID=A0A5J6GHF7_STRKN|nr:isocitrate lyase/phosphoenolpyruvate mutase family protein [Streptomyces kanamyceticus]QEU94477.1 isocitrate lyase/phosphoenolpyruvate mutase family protein [Streptomyces kanamyceticus]